MADSILEKTFIETNRGKIFYFKNLSFPHAPTLVFLHGLASNHTTWNFAAAVSEKMGFNFLTPDLRGHGHSDKTKRRGWYKIPVFTDDLENIIKKENLDRIILVGYSFGGSIALDYAIKCPANVAGLILISANHVNPLRYKHLEFLTWPAYGAVQTLAWLLLWQQRKNYYYFDQAKDSGYWRSTLKGYLTMPLAVNFWLLAQNAHLDFRRDLDKINCPTLLVKSQSDPFLSLKEINDMARQIKSSKIAIINEPSHFLASRHQEKIMEIISEFLKEIKLY